MTGHTDTVYTLYALSNGDLTPDTTKGPIRLTGPAPSGKIGNAHLLGESILQGIQDWKSDMPAAPILDHPQMLWWCADCVKYTGSHPLDHLDESHPPKYADGSRALPQRFALT